MASASPTNSKLVLEPNVPQTIALKYPTGKLVTSQFSEEKQVYFTLADGRSAYFPASVGVSITNLMLGTREPFLICKRWNGSKQQTPRYDVWLTPAGERDRVGQDDPPAVVAEDPPSELEERMAASIAIVQSRRRGDHLIQQRPTAPLPAAPAAAQPTIQQGTQPSANRSSLGNPLAEEAAVLVDAFAAVLEYSLTTYQGRVKPDDVRSLLLSCYIGRQKGGAR